MIIDRYISSEIARPLTAGLGLLILIFVGYSLAQFLGLAADGQLSVATAFKLVGLNTVIALEVLLPSALFFSVLLAVGRLYRDSEMYAWYGTGVSRARVLESVLKLSLLVALVTGFISISGRPWAYRQSYELEARAAATFDLKKMAAGEFVELRGSDYVFFAKGVDLERGLHQDVFLFKRYPDEQRAEVLVAASASLPALHPEHLLEARFLDGYDYLLDEKESRDVTMAFGELVVRLPNPAELKQYRRKAENTFALAGSSSPKDIAEYQWRVTTPLATVLLALIAVPLARTTPRESRTRNFFIALLVYIALFGMISVLRTMVEQETLSPIPGLFLAYIVEGLLLVALVAMPRMARRR